MIKLFGYNYVIYTMNEEKYIEEKVGRRNPFVVPEGYFDTFADQMMASLPERQPQAKRLWLRPLRYAAAVVCILALGALAWFTLSPVSQQPLQAKAVKVSTDVAFDEAADYVMLDNSDIYACLSDE